MKSFTILFARIGRQ